MKINWTRVAQTVALTLILITFLFPTSYLGELILVEFFQTIHRSAWRISELFRTTSYQSGPSSDVVDTIRLCILLIAALGAIKLFMNAKSDD